MKPPHWLDYVLATNAHLDMNHADGRAQLACRIVEALPRAAMEVSIAATLLAEARQDNPIGPAELAHKVLDRIVQIWCIP